MNTIKTLDTVKDLDEIFSKGNIIVVDPLSSECFIYEPHGADLIEGELVFLSENMIDNLDEWEKNKVVACEPTTLKPQGYVYSPWGSSHGKREVKPVFKYRN